MKKWYHICYDTCGDGFKPIPEPYCYALGKSELEAAIVYAISELEILEEDICIFELRRKK